MRHKRFSWSSVLKVVRDEHISRKKVFIVLFVATLFHIGLSLLTKSPTVFVTAVHTAKQILEGKMLYKDVEKPLTTGYAAWPPIYPYSLALWFLFMGQSEFSAKLFCVATTIVAGYLCYSVGKEFLTNQQAYYAMILFFFSPYSMLISLGGHFENYAIVFFLLAIWAIQRGHISLGGIALGIGIMIKIFPGLLLVAILPFWIARREYRWSFLFFITTAITASLIALPFLWICPNEFRYWLFDFHAERDKGGVSTYYYWLPWLFDESSLILFIQILLLAFLALAVFISTKKEQDLILADILIQWVPIILITYFLSTRILYPRYLALIIPFLAWQTVVLWKRTAYYEAVGEQLLTCASMVGTMIWTLPAYLESFHPISFRPAISLNNPLSNPLGLLYWIGASIFSVTLFFLLVNSISLSKRRLLGLEFTKKIASAKNL